MDGDLDVELGFHHHQAGRLTEAETLYRTALARSPRNGRALHLLGVAACQRGNFAEGAELIARAISFGPAGAEMHLHLGNALCNLDRLDEAAENFRKAAQKAPDLVEAHANLGGIMRHQGRLADAEKAWRTVVALAPTQASAHFNLANVLYDRRALDEAVGCYRTASRLQPVYPDALCNLGGALRELGRYDEAVIALCQAVNQDPNHGATYSNLGNTLKDMERLDDAEAAARVAAGLLPSSAVARFNLAAVLQETGRLDEAGEHYRAALALAPDYVEAHWNHALLLLRQGRFKEGWAEHEWRAKTDRPWTPRRDFAQPQWRGEPIDGKTILIHSEQGLGDVIQFCRYASLVAGCGARVVVLSYRPLERLLRTVPGIAAVAVDEADLPPFDCHVPMLSLPFLLGTERDTIPASVPYVHAEPAAVETWRTRLRAIAGRKVGLVWSGDPRPNDPEASRTDRRRSLRLEQLAGLAGVPGVTLISLQKGAPAQQLRTPPAGLTVLDYMDEIGDFADTAALVAALDLVVTVDTSVAHLAGALAKPVWILSRFDGCWRWLEGRDDSPWYPTARLFRQTRRGDWSDTLERLKAALERFSSQTNIC